MTQGCEGTLQLRFGNIREKSSQIGRFHDAGASAGCDEISIPRQLLCDACHLPVEAVRPRSLVPTHDTDDLLDPISFRAPLQQVMESVINGVIVQTL